MQIMIDALTDLAKANPDVTAMWLYGSRARGQEHANSDYDIAILFTHYITCPLDRRLRPETLALNWAQAITNKTKIDIALSIVDITLAPVPLAFTVIKDNKLLHTKNEYNTILEEQKILSKWELDYQHHVKNYA